MFTKEPGVQRPKLYFIVAVFCIAIAMPLAINSGQTRLSGIFDECFDTSCEVPAVYASID